MNIRKRILAAVTSAAIAFSAVPFTLSLTASASTKIKLGEYASYEMETSDILDSTGKYYYGIDNSTNYAIITGYQGEENVVNIPSELDGYPVIGIYGSGGVFSGGITRVVVPTGIEFIGDYVFADCSLTSISLPDTLWYIGNDAFVGTNLRSVTLPDNVTYLGSGAFSGCGSLISVQLPEGLTCIPSYCFSGCTALRSIRMPSTVDNIFEAAFYECTNLSSVVFPETMTMGLVYELGNGSQFYGCTSLTKVTLPDSMKYIPDSMFEGSGLRNVKIGSNTQAIDSNAFEGCTFDELYIPDGAVIDNNYLNCTVRNKLSVPASLINVHAHSYDTPYEYEMRGCYTTRYVKADGYDDYYEMTIADGKSTFDLADLYGCAYTKLILPDTLTRLTNSNNQENCNIYEITLGGGLMAIDDGALDNLTGLKKINVSKAGKYSSYDGILFEDGGTTLVKIPGNYQTVSDPLCIPYGTKTIADGAVRTGCNLSIPETVTYIGENNYFGKIYGMAGSEAERYAIEKELEFVDISNSDDEEKYPYTETVITNQTITRDNTNFTQPTFSGDYGEVTGTLVYTDQYGSTMTYEGVRAMLANFRSGTYTIGYRFTPASNSVYGGVKTGTITLDMTKIPVAAPAVQATSRDSKVMLSWQPVENAVAYEIDLMDGEDIVKVGDTTQTSYAYTDVNVNESYSFLVRAYDGDSFSDYTTDNIVTVIVKENDPFGDVVLKGHSLVIADDIGVNFYMELPDEILADDEAYMEFSQQDNTVSRVMVSDAQSKQLGETTCYVFPCYVAACEMTDTINARLSALGEYSAEFTYSVQEYAQSILADPTGYADTVPIINAMLNYGSEAQTFFDHNTSTPANSILADNDKTLTDKDDIDLSSYKYSTMDLDNSISFSGISLSLRSKIALKMYFDSENDLNIGSFTVKCGSNNVSADRLSVGRDSNGTYLAISDISAGDFDQSFIVSTGSLTIRNISVFSYLKQALESTDSKLVDIARAIYDYNEAVEEYIAA